MKNRIAFDLDDVLSRTAERMALISNAEWGTNLTVDDISEDWPAMWGVSAAEADRRSLFLNSAEVVLSYEAFEEAMPVLDALKSKRVDPIITTSRPNLVSEPTRLWLNRNFKGIFSGIYHAGIYDGPEDPSKYSQTKAELYRALDVQYVIDDQPKHVLGARKVGRAAVMLGDYAWNRSQRTEVSKRGGVWISDWQGVGEYFEERLNRTAA